MNEALDLLIREYLSKCECCDECIAEFYCIGEFLRSCRNPVPECEQRLKEYLLHRVGE